MVKLLAMRSEPKIISFLRSRRLQPAAAPPPVLGKALRRSGTLCSQGRQTLGTSSDGTRRPISGEIGHGVGEIGCRPSFRCPSGARSKIGMSSTGSASIGFADATLHPWLQSDAPAGAFRGSRLGRIGLVPLHAPFPIV